MAQEYSRLKAACYTVNITMAALGNLSPLLFITFHHEYNISYSLLGLLVLINFATQLLIDLIFSFFSHKFNIPLAVKLTPVVAIVGLGVFALCPYFWPQYAYAGLVAGTVIFSASGGLAEVLISPTIAAIPCENPDHEMSKLHSIYAWGVVLVVVITTVFLLCTGGRYWHFLALGFSLIPLTAALLFWGTKIPQMPAPERVFGVLQLIRKKELWLCVLAIFLGGAAECTMAQWASGYLEQSLGIPKVWGDIGGVAMFAVMLGLGRSLYAKIGQNIGRVLCLGAIGATLCYLIAAISPIPLLGLMACGFTGFCVSMLWPGSLIVGSDRFPTGGVFIFAIMAAGGDMGAAIGPQLVGIITDAVEASSKAVTLAARLGITTEQLGMKAGMLVGMLFPLLAVFVYLAIWKGKKKPAPSKDAE
ncbi:MAG: MFS transporter [Ruminococcaceae bacterium]|nr:MFS transporter [Oscillospiraceae bacterium]